jgi:hypothetical protein
MQLLLPSLPAFLPLIIAPHLVLSFDVIPRVSIQLILLWMTVTFAPAMPRHCHQRQCLELSLSPVGRLTV